MFAISYSCNLELGKCAITDNHWFKENVLCLLHNSVKFSADGTGQIDVTCTVNTLDSIGSSHLILVEVEDNGIGVPPDKLDSLFKPFSQVNRSQGGTGLGLFSLSRRIEALNGSFGVRRRTDGNRGSCFWFSIPYKMDTSVQQVLNPQEFHPILVAPASSAAVDSLANEFNKSQLAQ